MVPLQWKEKERRRLRRLARLMPTNVLEATSERVLFSVPVLTLSEPNMRGHWKAKDKRRKEQMMTMEAAARLCIPKEMREQIVFVEFHRVGQKLLDRGNLEPSFKYVQDALADVLGTDDSYTGRITWHYTQRAVKVPDKHGLLVAVATSVPSALRALRTSSIYVTSPSGTTSEASEGETSR